MTKISKFSTINEAWKFLNSNFKDLQAYLIPFFVCLVILMAFSQSQISTEQVKILKQIFSLESMQYTKHDISPHSLFFTLMVSVLGLLIRMPVYAALSRKIVLGETQTSNLFSRIFKGRELKMLWNSLLVILTIYFALFMILFVSFIIVIFFIFLFAVGSFNVQFNFHSLLLIILAGIAGFAFFAFILFTTFWLKARFSLVLPSTAIDEKTQIWSSFKTTKGNALSLFAMSFLLQMLPGFLILPFTIAFVKNYVVATISILILGYFELVWMCCIGFAYKKIVHTETS
jgi:hypothetical protein